MGASTTDTFLGKRNRRIARRRGKTEAIAAVGRSILVIVWHLLSDPEARFHDLGSDFYDKVTLEPPSDTPLSRSRPGNDLPASR